MNKTVVFDENGAHVLHCKPLIYSKKKAVINPISTPDCHPMFWKLDGYKIIEVPRSEKIQRLSSTNPKNYWYLYLYYQTEITLLTIAAMAFYLLARR